jgi:hypothetical protein
MSDGKGKHPSDPVDEGWDALDEAIEAAASATPVAPAAPDAARPAVTAAAPVAPAAPDAARPAVTAAPAAEAAAAPAVPVPEAEQVLSLQDRGKTDPENQAVNAEALEDFDEVVPTAKHLPRDLPTAPPGERRVARTIMGVGTPELQAMIKQRLAGTTPVPEPPQGARAPSPPTPKPPPAKAALATPTGPAAPPTAKVPLLPKSPPAPAPPAPAPPPALADTDEVAALANPSDEVPPISALVSTAPLASPGPTPPPPAVPFAETSPAIEPHTVRVRSGGPPAVTPTAATRRGQPERPKGPGPSNLALVLLWTVALLSVGLALYLYFARG